MNEQNFPPPTLPAVGPSQRPMQHPLPPTQPPVEPKKHGFARGFGRGVGFGLGLGAMLLATSVVSMVVMVISLASATATVSGTATSNVATIWGSGSNAVRAINISGPIMSDASDGALLTAGTYGNEIAQEIDALSAEDSPALILLVNTPGGSIGGSRAISDAVERYQERTGQAVLVHVSTMSASGGVYATATADEIISDHGTFIGSIGVIFGPFTQYDDVVATSGSLLESGVTTEGGITQEYLTAGRSKDFGNPFRPMTQEERQHYTESLAVEYDNFVAHVSTHRGIPSERIVNDLGAFLFEPEAAKANGLIDDVMGRDEFFRHVAEQAGLDPDDTRVEAVRPPGAWESLFGVSRAFGHAPAAEQGAGIEPVLSNSICGGAQPLVFAGDLAGVCG